MSAPLNSAHSASQEKSTNREGRKADDECRCKEASRMTPRELLALMMNDLAFWKKTKKGR